MNPKTCPTCHAPLPENAPGGFCPSCLLRDAEETPAFGPAAPSVEEIAAAFPRLEVMELIGQGGMGFVYKARQPDLDRTIALKILAPELGRDPAFAERFAREARTLGKLHHPNIVTVFEHGKNDGFFYLMMEYVDGVNLRQAMRAGRFTPEQALTIVPGICDALQYAHEQGVWHRDIKPENILLDREGKVKIADFGIARIVGDPRRDFTLTMTGHALGSAAYMAPEQHEKPHDVDHRADIYSLGVVIYEMLTGELPLGRFPLPSQRAAVDARIDEIVLRTLEKERELRQQSAVEVKTDVQGAAKPAVHLEKRDPSSMKWPLILITAGTGLLLAFSLSADPFIVRHFWKKLFSPVAYAGTTLEADSLAYLQFLKLWFGLGLCLLIGGVGFVAQRWNRGKISLRKASSPPAATVEKHWTAAATASAFPNFHLSVGLWIGGVAGVVAGRFTSPIVAGFGLVAAALGLSGCCWILWKIRHADHPKEHRLPLLILVFWPVMATLCSIASGMWFETAEDAGSLAAADPTVALFGFAAVAVAAPLIIGRIAWNLLGKASVEKAPNRLENLQALAAALLILSGIVLVKWVVERTNAYQSYRAKFIQLSHDIHWPEDADLIRLALAKAVPPHLARYRMALLAPGDSEFAKYQFGAETPVVVLEASFPNDRDCTLSNSHFDAVAQRLRASLPKRIEVNSWAGGAWGPDDTSAPPEIQSGYRQLRPWPYVFLTIPLFVVVLSVASRRPVPWVLSVLAFCFALLVVISPKFQRPSSLPPSMDGMAPLKPLPMPEYDFSTTRDAMESMIKAAKKGDVETFKRGVSSKLLEKTMAETTDWSEPMRDFAKLRYSHQTSQEGDVATVLMNGTTPENSTMNLVRENGEWKLAMPERDALDESPKAAMEEIIRAAKEKNKQALKRRCSQSLIANVDDDAQDKTFNHLASYRVTRDRVLDASNAEVTIESPADENKATFSMVREDGMWKLTEKVVQHRWHR